MFASVGVLVWAGVFFVGNAVYFPLVEEADLTERFGDDYAEYAANVPRWLPRFRGWPGEP